MIQYSTHARFHLKRRDDGRSRPFACVSAHSLPHSAASCGGVKVLDCVRVELHLHAAPRRLLNAKKARRETTLSRQDTEHRGDHRRGHWTCLSLACFAGGVLLFSRVRRETRRRKREKCDEAPAKREKRLTGDDHPTDARTHGWRNDDEF